MVQELPSPTRSIFPDTAPAAYPVFYRTYSRKHRGTREHWDQVCDRTIAGLTKLGRLTPKEQELVDRMQRQLRALTSGRWLWVGGTPWLERSENFHGSYNCTSTNVVDWRAFGLMMDLAMQGCGTGAVLQPEYIAQLPGIRQQLNVTVTGSIGATPVQERGDRTTVTINGQEVRIRVGDSRQGWVRSYTALLELCSDPQFAGAVDVIVDVSDVRPSGEPLQGFGGVANPVRLPELYQRIAAILNRAAGRQLTSVECCLLIDEAAICIVAGNIRRSAGMRQFSSADPLAATAKDNLWQQDAAGNWRIDPDRDALRMANHTRVFRQKPTLEECLASVRKQYYSGEGAIQWAGEAIARANADLMPTPELKQAFLATYAKGEAQAKEWLRCRATEPMDDRELTHRLQRYGLNPCGEIIGADFHCNLSEIHLNLLDPHNLQEQAEAFTAGALSVASLLHHQFQEERYQFSRLIDPIVGVSFTGLFDFFVHAFGVDWLRWWEAGRPEDTVGQTFKAKERQYLETWRELVHEVIWDYCDRHRIKRPNRCTTVQPSGTKSLLTGASPGWHPPKSQRFLRRITCRKNDPVALACMDFGYNLVPSQSDKDEQGNLLNDPFDPRCTEWLIEIPVAVSWADLPGADVIDIAQFSAATQFDFYMQVQRFYTTHNTSATIELRESEIESLSALIYESIQGDRGYISAALLSRFDDLQTFPRLPFEPISRERYEKEHIAVCQRRRSDNFQERLNYYDFGHLVEAGPAGCDSDKCLLPEQVPNS
ncbi:MAG: ribonucleoside-triphosphate reductase, adenosylcobalamin-dependent [Oscillatoriales cyanobacterium SM2_2_1]|nr:ribonucleoside-triphosphate reductase, adenosylcobalamin-dependent [Oscillatoriales cyanobacterium SM2_2_1]